MTKHYSKNTYSDNYARHLIRGNVTGNLGINSAVRFSAIYGEGVDRIQVLNTIRKENTFRFWWYIIFGLLGVSSLFINPAGWLSVVELFVLMINIDLVSRGKVIGIWIGILDCLIYILICSRTGLWGEVIKMAAINIPLNIVAIISWSKNIKSQSTGKKASIEVKRLNAKSTLFYVLIFLVAAVAGYFFLEFLGTTSLIISTISFAIGIISKTLNGQRYMESYVVSLIGNFISLSLWISTLIQMPSNPEALVQIVVYMSCVFNNSYSFLLWRGVYRKAKVNGGRVLARRKVKINRVIKLRRMYRELYWDKKVDIVKNSWFNHCDSKLHVTEYKICRFYSQIGVKNHLKIAICCKLVKIFWKICNFFEMLQCPYFLGLQRFVYIV